MALYVKGEQEEESSILSVEKIPALFSNLANFP
jgi:hypothetical protein